MTRVLITGATGFLGTKLCQAFADEYEVCTTALHDKINPVDVRDEAALVRLFRGFAPEVVIHAAAIVDVNVPNIREVNREGTKNVVKCAHATGATIIFTSSESVYGGKETTGNYRETDSLKPRSDYGQTRLDAEQIIAASGLPFLITRSHRYVGVSHGFSKPKQFPDTLAALKRGEAVHLDSRKLFHPCLTNNLVDVYRHHISNNLNGQVVINVGIIEATTYFDFVSAVARSAQIDVELIHPDGDETGWPQNSTLCLDKAKDLGYPSCTKAMAVEIIARELL